MAMWNRCTICGRAIPIGELCYGVKNWRGDPTGGDTICRDCLVPENAPTLTPPNGWVSVEERMPEDDLPEGTNRLQIKVLVAIKAKNGYTVRTQNRIRQEQSWSNKEPFTAWYWKFSHGEVTHWMPLPVPPDRRPPEGEAK